MVIFYEYKINMFQNIFEMEKKIENYTLDELFLILKNTRESYSSISTIEFLLDRL